MQSPAPVSIADRARSMSTSSLVSVPVTNDGSGTDAGGGAAQLSRTMSRPAAKSKDMFSWFSETVIISQIVKNWPG